MIRACVFFIDTTEIVTTLKSTKTSNHQMTLKCTHTAGSAYKYRSLANRLSISTWERQASLFDSVCFCGFFLTVGNVILISCSQRYFSLEVQKKYPSKLCQRLRLDSGDRLDDKSIRTHCGWNLLDLSAGSGRAGFELSMTARNRAI